MRQYDNSFKLEAVNLVISSGRTTQSISKELDIPYKTLARWVVQYKNEGEASFVGSGNQTREKKEEKDTALRIRELEEENRILKKAMRIFTKDQK